VLDDALRSMQTLARQTGVTLRYANDDPLPLVPMDRRRLRQVFENLLKNAIEHSPEGAEVTVTARTSDRATVSIEVADRGSGFAPADLPRVFEPFFTRRRGGTGLGLSLARRIIDEHAGTIRASNRAGGGALMVVTLPIAE
jgi:signal transduction histidine kinase